MRDINEPINNNSSMRAKFKQRIAGGAVLLIVLAIFLPFIFNHAHRASVNLDTAPAAQEEAAPPVSAPAPAPAQTAAVVPASEQSGLTSSQNESSASAQSSDSTVVLPPPQAGTAATAPASSASTEAAPPSGDPDQASAPAAKNETLAANPKSPDPALTQKTPVPAASHWILQVGSFSNDKNAQKLTAQLRAQGFHAYMQKSANQLVRVYVGPLESLQQAQKVQERIQSKLSVSALVHEVKN